MADAAALLNWRDAHLAGDTDTASQLASTIGPSFAAVAGRNPRVALASIERELSSAGLLGGPSSTRSSSTGAHPTTTAGFQPGQQFLKGAAQGIGVGDAIEAAPLGLNMDPSNLGNILARGTGVGATLLPAARAAGVAGRVAAPAVARLIGGGRLARAGLGAIEGAAGAGAANLATAGIGGLTGTPELTGAAVESAPANLAFGAGGGAALAPLVRRLTGRDLLDQARTNLAASRTVEGLRRGATGAGGITLHPAARTVQPPAAGIGREAIFPRPGSTITPPARRIGGLQPAAEPPITRPPAAPREVFPESAGPSPSASPILPPASPAEADLASQIANATAEFLDPEAIFTAAATPAKAARRIGKKASTRRKAP